MCLFKKIRPAHQLLTVGRSSFSLHECRRKDQDHPAHFDDEAIIDDAEALNTQAEPEKPRRGEG